MVPERKEWRRGGVERWKEGVWREGKREVKGRRGGRREKKEEDEGKGRGENDIGLVSFSS